MVFMLAAGGLAQGVVSLAGRFYCFILALALAGQHRVIFFYGLAQAAVHHLAVDLQFDVLELAHEVLAIEAFPG